MAIAWQSPIPITGPVAMAVQILLTKDGLFELTNMNYPVFMERNREEKLITDIDTGQPPDDMTDLIGFRWWYDFSH